MEFCDGGREGVSGGSGDDAGSCLDKWEQFEDIGNNAVDGKAVMTEKHEAQSSDSREFPDLHISDLYEDQPQNPLPDVHGAGANTSSRQVMRYDEKRTAIVRTFRESLTDTRNRILNNDQDRVKSGIGAGHLLATAGAIGKKLNPSLFQGGNVLTRALARCGDRFSYIQMRLKPIDEAMVELSVSVERAIASIDSDLHLVERSRAQLIAAIGEMSQLQDQLQAELESVKAKATALTAEMEQSDLPQTDPAMVGARQQLAALMQSAVHIDASLKDCEDSVLLMESEADANEQASVDLQSQANNLRKSEETLHTTIFKLKSTAMQQRMLSRAELDDAVHALNNKLLEIAVRQETKLSLRLSEASDRPALEHKTLETILTVRGKADKTRQNSIEKKRVDREKSRRALSTLALKHDVGSSITPEERQRISDQRKRLASFSDQGTIEQ